MSLHETRLVVKVKYISLNYIRNELIDLSKLTLWKMIKCTHIFWHYSFHILVIIYSNCIQKDRLKHSIEKSFNIMYNENDSTSMNFNQLKMCNISWIMMKETKLLPSIIDLSKENAISPNHSKLLFIFNDISLYHKKAPIIIRV